VADRSEWQHPLTVSQKRIQKAPNTRTKQQRIDTDHFMRFMVASCGRVDEIRGIRFRSCRYRAGKGDTPDVLLVTASGKRGIRDLLADIDAVGIVTERLGKADDLMFPEHHREAFRELLDAAGLRKDRHGNLRNFKSLRATAISRQVLSGKDLIFVARNAGTSLVMVDTFYARRLSAESTSATRIRSKMKCRSWRSSGRGRDVKSTTCDYEAQAMSHTVTARLRTPR
jgi:hypothetical protein